MCGITGFVFRNTNIPPDLLYKMTNNLTHRGPDDEGFFIDTGICLGHRRLSIIDIKTGKQPIHNEDKTIWIVFNGEIYNFPILREKLIKMGHEFYTNSDTEVIIHCYEQYQEKCVEHLQGMFAFAIWDKNKQQLMLARDRIGVKPLFYTQNNGNFLFSSELNSLLQYDNIKKEPNIIGIDHYITYNYIPSPMTGFKNIYKLKPGHYLIYKNGNISLNQYWYLNYEPKLVISEKDAITQFMELFEEAIKIRLISEVPIGAFLSGGIDSSSIVAIMSKLSDKKVKTFSIGFEEENFNELKFSSIVAKKFNTDHQEFIVKPNILELLPKLITHFGEPFADSSAIPTYYVSQITRNHVTVALSGDSGDELLAGYDRYKIHKILNLYNKFPKFFKNIIKNCIEFLPYSSNPKSFSRRVQRLLSLTNLNQEIQYIQSICCFNNEEKLLLYSNYMKEKTKGVNSYDYLLNLYKETNALDFLDKTLNVDTRSYLPEDLLVKVDITSMMNSLEVRSPFLDHLLIEFVTKLPVNLKLSGLTSKYILKQGMKDLLPKENIFRKKMGFGVPLVYWLKNELKDLLIETLLSPNSLNHGYFNHERVKHMVNYHIRGIKDYSLQLWNLLILELWYKKFIQ